MAEAGAMRHLQQGITMQTTLDPNSEGHGMFAKLVGAGFFGGEGLFFVQLTGPRRVILQTLPFSRLADRIIASAPSLRGRRREEGSVLGGLGALIDGAR